MKNVVVSFAFRERPVRGPRVRRVVTTQAKAARLVKRLAKSAEIISVATLEAQ